MLVSINTAAIEDTQKLAQFAAFSFCDTFGHIYPPEDLEYFLHEKYNQQVVAQQINDKKLYVLVAKSQNDEIIGYAMGGPMGLPFDDAKPNSYELYRLYIAPNAKGLGIAQKLYDAILERARELKAPEFYLGVYSENYRAQAFYKRQGFEIVGQYYYPVGKTLDDERIMRLKSEIFLELK